MGNCFCLFVVSSSPFPSPPQKKNKKNVDLRLNYGLL